MERFSKKYILILLLTTIFLLTGCSKLKIGIFDASKDNTTDTVTIAPDDNGNIDSDTDDNKLEEQTDNTTQTNNITPTLEPTLSDKELPIYTINADGALEPVTALIPDGNEITPELVVNKVVESLADQSITIGIDGVSSEDNTVIVSFKKNQAPYTNMGSGYEANILNAFAQSLIDNFSSVKKVIFRIEGKAYESGSFAYGINEPYMSK